MTRDDDTHEAGLLYPTYLAAGDPMPSFPSLDDLKDSTSRFPEVRPESRSSRSVLEVSPGSVKLSRSRQSSAKQIATRRPRRPIYEWSRKSRAEMVARLCSLDYEPMFSSGGSTAAMITLTYPGAWEQLVPTGARAKAHLHAFRKRYERRFGSPLKALWKMEFQRRGAVHFHLFCVPPDGEGFRRWLSETWAEIVGASDEDERARHLLAGTGLDYPSGVRARDPKRVAVYFTKHGSPNLGVKEYQNRPPALWVQAGNVGRFWGYWGLRPVTASAALSDVNAVRLGRILRRWARANTPPQTVAVWRISTRSGRWRRRAVRRRVVRLKAGYGFVVVNDGAAMGQVLAAALGGSDAPFMPPKNLA